MSSKTETDAVFNVEQASYVSSAQRGGVAQICNLLYRRFVIGRGSESSSAVALADVPQNAILRYSRLQICATLNTYQPPYDPGKTVNLESSGFGK